MVYDELSAEENLLFFAKLQGIGNRDQRVAQLLAEVGLAERKDSLVRTFSRGMRQRVAIARALLAAPSLLLFDEPATGLDPEATTWLTNQVRALRDSGCTVLMSLHGESEVASLATRAVRLDAGVVVADTRTGATFQSVFSYAGG
jgi:ABC-type multidrug transport system ATPase subunit